METCCLHMNTSTSTRGAGGGAPQLAPLEAGLQRDAQDSKPALFGPDAPVPREGPRRRKPVMIGCSRSIRSPLEPHGFASRRHDDRLMEE